MAVDDPPEFFGATDDSEAELGAEHWIADVISEGGNDRPFTDTWHPLRCPPEARGEVSKRFAISLYDVVQVAVEQAWQDPTGKGLHRQVALHPVGEARRPVPGETSSGVGAPA